MLRERKVHKASRRPSFSPVPMITHYDNAPLSLTVNSSQPKFKTNHMKSQTPFKACTRSIGSNYSEDIRGHLNSRQILEDVLAEILQSGISPQMRSKLIEWMFFVCNKYAAPRPVIYTAVKTLDRALTTISTDKAKFQLLGATCLFLSAKMHMPKAIPLARLVQECANSYTAQEFLECESQVLEALNYDITVPTVADFIELSEPYINTYSPLLSIIWFISDMHLQFSSFLRFKASTISAAIIISAFNCSSESIQNAHIKEIVKNEDWKTLYACIEEIGRVMVSLKKGSKKTVLEKTSNDVYRKMKEIAVLPLIPVNQILLLFPYVDI